MLKPQHKDSQELTEQEEAKEESTPKNSFEVANPSSQPQSNALQELIPQGQSSMALARAQSGKILLSNVSSELCRVAERSSMSLSSLTD